MSDIKMEYECLCCGNPISKEGRSINAVGLPSCKSHHFVTLWWAEKVTCGPVVLKEDADKFNRYFHRKYVSRTSPAAHFEEREKIYKLLLQWQIMGNEIIFMDGFQDVQKSGQKWRPTLSVEQKASPASLHMLNEDTVYIEVVDQEYEECKPKLMKFERPCLVDFPAPRYGGMSCNYGRRVLGDRSSNCTDGGQVAHSHSSWYDNEEHACRMMLKHGEIIKS